MHKLRHKNVDTMLRGLYNLKRDEPLLLSRIADLIKKDVNI